MNLPYVKETLSNGLDVIIHEDHRCPIVAVDIWYHVGSKNERPGRTGFAHLFEHLMFEGSQHYNKGFFEPLQQAGAALNGSTNTDRTNYWEVVPTNGLELALWMESDRMGFLLPALTKEKFENQRDVVLNERRQNYENRPYGLAVIALLAALYPPTHPYHWPTIGAAEDVRTAGFDDVREFFRTYYHPGNASLVLAGDVDPHRGFMLVREYFEDLDRGPIPPKVTNPESLGPGRSPLVLEDRVDLPRLYCAWHTPALFAPGDAELDLLADVLAHSKTSRCYRSLVYDRRVATEVFAVQNSRELAGFFELVATAVPGHDLEELEWIMTSEIERLAEGGPSPEELERSQTQIEANFVQRLQTVGGFGGKADQLNAYSVFTGDPGYFEKDRARYQKVTAQDVRTAAQRLVETQRVSLSVVPHGRGTLALPQSVPVLVS